MSAIAFARTTSCLVVESATNLAVSKGNFRHSKKSAANKSSVGVTAEVVEQLTAETAAGLVVKCLQDPELWKNFGHFGKFGRHFWKKELLSLPKDCQNPFEFQQGELVEGCCS